MKFNFHFSSSVIFNCLKVKFKLTGINVLNLLVEISGLHVNVFL